MIKVSEVAIVFTALYFLCGCGIPEPTEISPGLYSIYKRDTAGIFGNAHKMQNDVVTKANSFAASRGRIAAPASSSFTPMGSGPGQFATFDYRFYALTPSEYSDFQKRVQEIQRKRKRDWDSLTPAQRFAYEQREMELSQGAQALALTQQSINQAASAQFQNTRLQQQQINAYQQRTRAMNEPVNVNLKGNINHTFDPVYTPPLRTPFSGY
jgi:hypothetical protein